MKTTPLTIILLLLAATGSPATAGETMYALSSPTSPQLIALDSTTGGHMSSIPVTGHEALFGGLSFSTDGSALYSIDGYNDSNSDRTFRIDPQTAAGVVVGNTGFNWNFRCVESHPDGTLYAARDNQLFTLDTTTGAATFVASITGSSLDQTTAIAIDSLGQAFIVDIGNVGLFSLDLTTGAATHLGDLGLASYFRDLAFDSTDTLWGQQSGPGGLHTVDIGTVSATLMHASTGYWGIAFAPAFPEPGGAYCFGDSTGANCPCSAFGGPGQGCANSGGAGATLTGSGIATFSIDTFVLDIAGVPGSKPGLVLRGNNQVSNPAGDGILCTSGGSMRSQVQITSASGTSTFQDFHGSGFGSVANAGAPTNFQFWYRDPQNSCSGAGFNFTNGWTVTYAP